MVTSIPTSTTDITWGGSTPGSSYLVPTRCPGELLCWKVQSEQSICESMRNSTVRLPRYFSNCFQRLFQVFSQYFLSMRAEFNTQEHFTIETNQEKERPKRLATIQQVFLVKYLKFSIITSTILLVLIRSFIQIFKTLSPGKFFMLPY